ncbi:hypothetical protein M378DRAFT_960867 [Amanita muscaria Koide BX008]|uniref:Uncharacterized protein n=1 Tax=Amanita muscaria (strain Koide BX008) TaxID=946122 RepID=A0A0C2T0E6_AMAMK|nr:hypothetical protein M378DRAFT_960867 [Amanita muscaria Koide BX008]
MRNGSTRGRSRPQLRLPAVDIGQSVAFGDYPLIQKDTRNSFLFAYENIRHKTFETARILFYRSLPPPPSSTAPNRSIPPPTSLILASTASFRFLLLPPSLNRSHLPSTSPVLLILSFLYSPPPSSPIRSFPFLRCFCPL